MGRHSAPRRTPTAALVAVPAVAVAGIIGGLVYVNNHDGDATKPAAATTQGASGSSIAGCSHVTPLAITTTDDMEPVLAQITKRLESSTRDCVDYTVTAEGSSVTASGLMSGANETTQVWIPDSSLWAQRVTSAAPSVKLEQGPVFATSPVVFTIPHGSDDKARPGPLPWSELISQQKIPVRVATPERSTASLLALLGVQKAVASDAQQNRTLQALMLGLSRSTQDERELRRQATTSSPEAVTFPASEQQIFTMNTTHPDSRVRAMTPSEGAPQFDYRLVTVTSRKAPDPKAVEALRNGLAEAESVEALRKAGFRIGSSEGPGVEGVPARMPKAIATPEAKEADTALRAWVTMSRQTRMLAVIDTSESMKKAALPGMNRMDLAKSAAIKALEKFPDASQIGLWSFDLANPEQPKDWNPLVPIKPLNDTTDGVNQRALLGAKAKVLNWRKANGTSLNDTVWAAYQEVQNSYQPDFANAVILLTDGKNEDPDSISEADLIAKLKHASRDSSRPVRLVLIGISSEADQAALRRIADAVPDGDAYDASKPENIYRIMQEALTRRDITTPAQ